MDILHILHTVRIPFCSKPALVYIANKFKHIFIHSQLLKMQMLFHNQELCLRVRIRDRGNKENLVWVSTTGCMINGSLLMKPSCSSSRMLHAQSLVLLGDFNHADICWKSSMASCRQSRRFLECIEDNFPSQVTDTPTWGDAMLDLMLTNASKWHQDWKQPGLQWSRFGGVHSPEGYGTGKEYNQDPKF